MRLLRYPAYLATCLGHLIVDLLNGQMGVLLAALSVALGLTNAQIGVIAMLYSMMGSLSQPFFGWLADKDGGRWTTPGGVLWMAVFYALFAISPAPWALPLLVAAALGSGAFHPPGTATAARVGAVGLAGQAATAASIFFLFGQAGLSAGPALGGYLVEHGGRAAVLGLAGVALPIGLFMAWAMRGVTAVTRAPGTARAAGASAALPLFVVVLLISGLRVWAQTAITTFAPKFYQDQGVAPSDYGAIVALFMAGTAAGGLLGSWLADRWSYPRVVVGSLVLSIAPLFVLPLVDLTWVPALALVAGVFNGGPHSILVTMAQRALPNRAGFASGVILGSQFALAALGTYLTGWLADLTSLTVALQSNAGLALLATLLSLALLAEARRQPVAPPTGAPGD